MPPTPQQLAADVQRALEAGYPQCELPSDLGNRREEELSRGNENDLVAAIAASCDVELGENGGFGPLLHVDIHNLGDLIDYVASARRDRKCHPDMIRDASGWERVLPDRLRRWFDAAARRKLFRRDPAILVILLGIWVVPAAIWRDKQTAGACEPRPFSIFDFELSFSPPAFHAIVDELKKCHGGVVPSLWLRDLLVCAAGVLSLCAVYLWAERCVRRLPRGVPRLLRPRRLSSVVLWLAPFIIACNLAEDLCLHRAMHADGSSALVSWGSVFGALKWTLVALFGIGLVGMVLSGSRRTVLWHLRFSVIAVVGGSGALLLIPQGQDILERLVDDPTAAVPRILWASLALGLMSVVVWYCARTLTLVRITGESREVDLWRLSFERNVPRIITIGGMAVIGAAFARAGDGLITYLVVAVLSFAVPRFVRWVWEKAKRKTETVEAARVAAGGWRQFGKMFSMAVVGSVTALGVFVSADFDGLARSRLSIVSGDDFLLRLGAGAMLVLAWWLYFFIYYWLEICAVLWNSSPANAARRVRGLEKLIERCQTRASNAVPARIAELRTGYAQDTLPPQVWTRLRIAFSCTAIGAGLATAFPVTVGRWAGAILVLAFAVVNAVYLGSLLAFLGRRFHVPILSVLLLIAIVVSGWNDNHAIRQNGDVQPHAGDSLAPRFTRWIPARDTARGTTTPVILVAAAGGGLRAAYWTALTLAKLDGATEGKFGRHVFAISSVSGGSLGAALYVSLIRDRRRPGRRGPCFDANAGSGTRDSTLVHCVHEFMADDFLSPVLLKMTTADAVQQVSPFPIKAFDRASALERSWEDSYRAATGASTFAEPYRALAADTAVGLPMLLLNATHVQTGRRYVAAPFPDSGVFLDSRSVHAVLGADMPLSTAVHNSARFSFVSPAGRIQPVRGKRYGSVVDGGYFENSGLVTIGEVRSQVARLLPTLPDSARAKVYVVYLCNDPLSCRLDLAADALRTEKNGFGAEWWSPIAAVLDARDARGGLARAAALASDASAFIQLNVCDSIPKLAARAGKRDTIDLSEGRERAINPPLGWLLSKSARTWIEKSLVRDPADTTEKSCPERNLRQLARLQTLVTQHRDSQLTKRAR